MSERKHFQMPESLLWLSNELYWSQNLAPRAGAPGSAAPPSLRPETTQQLLSSGSLSAV